MPFVASVDRVSAPNISQKVSFPKIAILFYLSSLSDKKKKWNPAIYVRTSRTRNYELWGIANSRTVRVRLKVTRRTHCMKNATSIYSQVSGRGGQVGQRHSERSWRRRPVTIVTRPGPSTGRRAHLSLTIMAHVGLPLRLDRPFIFSTQKPCRQSSQAAVVNKTNNNNAAWILMSISSGSDSYCHGEIPRYNVDIVIF